MKGIIRFTYLVNWEYLERAVQFNNDLVHTYFINYEIIELENPYDVHNITYFRITAHNIGDVFPPEYQSVNSILEHCIEVGRGLNPVEMEQINYAYKIFKKKGK